MGKWASGYAGMRGAWRLELFPDDEVRLVDIKEHGGGATQGKPYQ